MQARKLPKAFLSDRNDARVTPDVEPKPKTQDLGRLAALLRLVASLVFRALFAARPRTRRAFHCPKERETYVAKRQHDKARMRHPLI